MTTQAESNIISDIGEKIRRARARCELTRDRLAEPRFTGAYISALERGSLRPSLKALEYLGLHS